ncbi:MAG: hypothetical protein GF317_14565 [Candidatus Lokiarchaeota archaeon]|nr:hypothetical protein [Candidatus Lokiarchaeota archaeon]MBD3200830.1 hypothetical protein [Candidatus Lokiarchaeota archaeon]
MIKLRWCPSCDNILIPKEKKLYCKACDEFFEFGKDQDDYKIIKKIKHDDKETAPIVIKQNRKDRISLEDRKAFEEFFHSS